MQIFLNVKIFQDRVRQYLPFLHVLSRRKRRDRCGAARLGAEVMFAGSVGKDPYGGQVLKSLRDVE